MLLVPTDTFKLKISGLVLINIVIISLREELSMSAALTAPREPVNTSVVASEVLAILERRTESFPVTFSRIINSANGEPAKRGQSYSVSLTLADGECWEVLAFRPEGGKISCGVRNERGIFSFAQADGEKVFQLLAGRYTEIVRGQSVSGLRSLGLPA
jgi:hypothetical protein